MQFPAVAARVSAQERADLDRVSEHGIEVLRELIDDLQRSPAQLSAQVIERWHDRPERESLEKLLQQDEVITTTAAAAAELRAALARLGELTSSRRLQELELKSKSAQLEDSELQEFHTLTRGPRTGKAPDG